MKILFLLLGLILSMSLIPQKSSAQDAEISFQVFYDELSPYGTWIENAEYGYVWLPDLGPGFEPYSSKGNWVFTDMGWAWVSDYSWGWAPFHYGRWFIDQVYGPMWVPGTEWAPAWVGWRKSLSYYGWAALAPGISLSTAYDSDFGVAGDQWTFVKCSDLGKNNINDYFINRFSNRDIVNRSSVITNVQTDKIRNVTFSSGPERSELEKVYGKSINPVTIMDKSKPGQVLRSHELEIYRPVVRSNDANEPKPVPAKFSKWEDTEFIKTHY
jgi:hypothetical protein